MVKIAPSILSADFSKLGEELVMLKEAGQIIFMWMSWMAILYQILRLVHSLLKAIRPITKLPLDVHLMIENPDQYIEDFAKAGADYITVHVEACRHLHRTIQFIKSFGVKAGVV